jgi:hypothetical protein
MDDDKKRMVVHGRSSAVIQNYTPTPNLCARN